MNEQLKALANVLVGIVARELLRTGPSREINGYLDLAYVLTGADVDDVKIKRRSATSFTNPESDFSPNHESPRGLIEQHQDTARRKLVSVALT